MGGAVFTRSHPHISVVRLSPTQYSAVCDTCHPIIQDHFPHPIIPAPAPEKPDHGDVDILVHTPHHPHEVDLQRLQWSLNANAFTKNGTSLHFAIPLPFSLLEGEQRYADLLDHGRDPRKPHFQLDVQQIELDIFPWATVLHSYGDLWTLLGMMATRYDLAISECGLQLRMPEIEKVSKRHGVLVLTSVPDEIFSFLGLCGRRYEEGFATLDELFVWMVRCRFFRRDVFVSSKAKDKDEGEGDMGKKGGGGGKKAERWMKGQFVRTWLVQHPEIGIEGQKDGGQLTKAMVLNEALDRFEKREEYQGKLARHKNEREISGLWGDVATTLPLTGRELGAVMVELKDAVRDGRSDSALEAKIDGLLGARGSSAESLLAVKCVIDDLVGIVGTIGDGEGKGDVDVDSGA